MPYDGETDGLATYAEIAATLQPYIHAARSGDAAGSRRVWFDDARIVGVVDGALMTSTPDELIAWTVGNGASPRIEVHIVSIDVAGSSAAARVEFAHWAGFRFTDFFALSRQPEGWRIVGKVFDAHDRGARSGEGAKDFAETEAVAATIDAYIDCARRGDGAAMRRQWFDHARVVGIFDGAPVSRDADAFCQRTASGPARNLAGRIVSIDRSGAAASARIELNDWNGIRYTDFLVLHRTEAGWKISAKAFDAHDRR